MKEKDRKAESKKEGRVFTLNFYTKRIYFETVESKIMYFMAVLKHKNKQQTLQMPIECTFYSSG